MTQRTGDARFPSTNYKTTRHCVAYLDFLGGTDFILHDDQNKHLNIINMIFEDALAEAKMCAKGVFVKIFSDNILLALPTDRGDRTQKIENIINLVSNFVHQAADNGYLIRGAITEGNFFHNDIIVYGKALVEAVNMEEKYAIYPRVLVQKEIATLLPQYCYLCADGWAMLNPYIFGIGSYDFINFRQTFLEHLGKNKRNAKVRQKIMWTINNFNTISYTMRQMGSLHSLIT